VTLPGLDQRRRRERERILRTYEALEGTGVHQIGLGEELVAGCRERVRGGVDVELQELRRIATEAVVDAEIDLRQRSRGLRGEDLCPVVCAAELRAIVDRGSKARP